MAGVGGAGGRAGTGEQAATARAALGHGMAELGDASRLALVQVPAGLAARGQAAGQQLRGGLGDSAAHATGAAARRATRAASQRRHSSTPSPVRALTTSV